MSNYVVTEDGTLLAMWWDGTGQRTRAVYTRPGAPALRDVATSLTRLSEHCWRVYVDPIREPDLPGGEPTDGRTELAGLPDIIDRPPLPGAGGYLVMSYVPVVWAAEQVGRAVHAADDPELREVVKEEVRAEAHAVLAADLGDLSGRARQAVLHSRTDASPAQVEAASQLFVGDMFGAPELLSDYDPTAAAVAATAWFHCAALVTAEELGASDLRDVVRLADDIEAMPVTTLSTVLAMLEAEISSPHAVVARLVQEARAVAHGHVLDLAALARSISATHDLADRVARTEQDRQVVLREFRLCVLDPARPAPDLLEALLDGIDGCWQLWSEQVATTDTGDLDEDLDEDLDDEEAEQDHRDEFADLVRERIALRTGA